MKFERSQFKSVPLTAGQLDQKKNKKIALYIFSLQTQNKAIAVAVVRSTLFQDPGKPPLD